MNKAFSWIFLLVSGAFFLFIVGLTGYRTEDARRHNTAAAREVDPRFDGDRHASVQFTHGRGGQPRVLADLQSDTVSGGRRSVRAVPFVSWTPLPRVDSTTAVPAPPPTAAPISAPFPPPASPPISAPPAAGAPIIIASFFFVDSAVRPMAAVSIL